MIPTPTPTSSIQKTAWNVPTTVGIMKLEAYRCHDHKDVATMKINNPTNSHAGATGNDIRRRRTARTWSPAPTYPNRTRYASRLCSDLAMSVILLPDGDLHLGNLTIGDAIRPQQRSRPRHRTNDEVQPIGVCTAADVRFGRIRLGPWVTVEHRSDAVPASLREPDRAEVLCGRDREPIDSAILIRQTHRHHRLSNMIEGNEAARLFGIRPTRVLEHRIRNLSGNCYMLYPEALMGNLDILRPYDESHAVEGEEPRVQPPLVVNSEPGIDSICGEPSESDLAIGPDLIHRNGFFTTHSCKPREWVV